MKDKRGNNMWARWRFFVPLVALLTVVAVLGLPGCSDKPLNVNTSQADDDFFNLPFDEESFEKQGGTTYLDVFVASRYVEADEGGTIVVHGNDGDFCFVVAPNSIPTSTLITVKIYIVEDQDAKVTIVYEFSPDGLVFSEPAWLVLDADVVAGIDEDAIDFYYLDGKRWLFQGTYRADQNREIKVEINHFSKYGSGSDCKVCA